MGVMKWIAAAFGGAAFLVVVLFFVMQKQGVQEKKIDVAAIQQQIDMKRQLLDPFFTPDKDERQAIKEEIAALKQELADAKNSIKPNQVEVDGILKDMKPIYKDSIKSLGNTAREQAGKSAPAPEKIDILK